MRGAACDCSPCHSAVKLWLLTLMLTHLSSSFLALQSWVCQTGRSWPWPTSPHPRPFSSSSISPPEHTVETLRSGSESIRCKRAPLHHWLPCDATVAHCCDGVNRLNEVWLAGLDRLSYQYGVSLSTLLFLVVMFTSLCLSRADFYCSYFPVSEMRMICTVLQLCFVINFLQCFDMSKYHIKNVM